MRKHLSIMPSEHTDLLAEWDHKIAAAESGAQCVDEGVIRRRVVGVG
jgi:hypothetical protein